MTNNPIDTYIAGLHRGFTIAQTRATAQTSEGMQGGRIAYMVWTSAIAALHDEIAKLRDGHTTVPGQPEHTPSPYRAGVPLISSLVADAVESVLKERAGIGYKDITPELVAMLSHAIGQRAHAWIVQYNLHRPTEELPRTFGDVDRAMAPKGKRVPPAPTTMPGEVRAKAYAVLMTDAGRILGASVFSESNPTQRIGPDTTSVVLFEVTGESSGDAIDKAQRDLTHAKWAWCGEVKTDGAGRIYRDARGYALARIEQIAELLPTGDEERALRVGAEELMRCAYKRADMYKADPKNATVSHRELELRAIVATILCELEGYVSK